MCRPIYLQNSEKHVTAVQKCNLSFQGFSSYLAKAICGIMALEVSVMSRVYAMSCFVARTNMTHYTGVFSREIEKKNRKKNKTKLFALC